MEASHSRRADNHERTRTALLRAAHELFVAQGYDATTVDEVATRAGVSRRTLFRYFPSKEQLALGDDARQLARFRAVLARRVDDETPLGAVRRALMAAAADLVRDDTVVESYRIIESSPTLLAADLRGDLEWEAAIAEALLDRVGHTEANERWARVTAGAVFGAVRVTLREWFASEGEADLAALGRAMFAVLEGGLTTPV